MTIGSGSLASVALGSVGGAYTPPPTITCDITSEPISVRAGFGISLTIVRKANGVIDASFTGTATISKVSGSGTLGGTLTTGAFVAGVATITTPTLTSFGNHVLRATLSSGQTDDTGVIVVRRDPFTSLGAYDVVAPIIDPVLGTLQHYEPMFPSHMTPGVPIGIMFVTNQSGYYNVNAPGGVYNGPGRLRSVDTLLAYADTHKSTYPFISVSFPIEDFPQTSKAGWTHACEAVAQRFEDDGITVDWDFLKAHGWSTGLVTLLNSVLRRADLFSSVSPNDGPYVSDEPTNSGNGPDFYGPLNGALYDAPAYADTALFPVVAAALKASRTAVYMTGGTETNGPGGPGSYARDIMDNRPFFTALQAIEPAAVMLSGSNVTSQMPGTYPRFVYERVDGAAHNHAAMQSWPVNSSNIASFLAWHSAQRRLPESGIGSLIFARINEQLFAGAHLLEQLESNARVSDTQESRPRIKFIR